MKTLIVCSRADVAKYLEKLFFPHPEGKLNDTLCIGAGAALMGCHFQRFVFMPGWDENLDKTPDASGQSHYDRIVNQIMCRQMDKKTTQLVYL